MDNENLYMKVKNKICDQIFEGQYNEGDRIPPERELAESLEVSRVTVRKSLELLEKDKLVIREVGRGTVISFENNGNPGELDMIVLIAPANNPFFAQFIARFQECAEKKNCLLLFVEKPKTESIEHCLYRLYKRGLRNVVVWLEDLDVNSDKLYRLRAIGMNMVFFDSDKGLPYADCVALNNNKAISSLYEELVSRGYSCIAYAGWDIQNVYSIDEREKIYKAINQTKGNCVHLNWRNKEFAEQKMEGLLVNPSSQQVDAIICGDRECGEIAIRMMRNTKKKVQIASVDEIRDPEGMEVIFYSQNLSEVVRIIFRSMENQCSQGKRWKAKLYLVEGIMHI